MAKKYSIEQIRARAREFISNYPGGIQLGQLIERIKEEAPATPENTIRGATWNLHVQFPKDIAKPERGLFTALDPKGKKAAPTHPPGGKRKAKVSEEQFYKGFADFLRGDLDEATEVTELGGNAMRGKWGTPDVVGVYKPRLDALIKFEREIVAAEIKVNPAEAITAFGQAVAYRLFATRSYLVLPATLPRRRPVASIRWPCCTASGSYSST